MHYCAENRSGGMSVGVAAGAADDDDVQSVTLTSEHACTGV